jgi:single-strand DNA-binding protein
MSTEKTNITILEGTLGRDVEQKLTTTGKAVANFSIAVDNGYGANKREPFWFSVVAWGPLAETAARGLSKGSKVTVYGRLTTRKYTNKAGVEVTVTEVVANAFDIREPRENSAPRASSQTPAPIAEEDIPF